MQGLVMLLQRLNLGGGLRRQDDQRCGTVRRCGLSACLASTRAMLACSLRITSSPDTTCPAANWASLRSSASSHPAGACCDISSMRPMIRRRRPRFQFFVLGQWRDVAFSLLRACRAAAGRPHVARVMPQSQAPPQLHLTRAPKRRQCRSHPRGALPRAESPHNAR